MISGWFITALLGLGPVEDFALRDHHGAEWRLADRGEPVVVLVFLGCDCPLAKLYAPRFAELHRTYAGHGVAFAGINANAHEGISDLARYSRTHQLPFPLLKDPGGRVAGLLGVERTPEVIVLDKDRRIRYRGRIDDQYTTTSHRAAPTRHDLAVALDELLEGRPVSVPKTEATGCVIARSPPAARAGAVTYARDIAPILNRRCVVCHRARQIAPFPLTSYKHAAGWAETIREVVAEGRMPPWSADPAHGRFANDPSLSVVEKRLIDEWVRCGWPEGDPADLPPAPTFPAEWTYGKPDVVVDMGTTFHVPASGVVEYQFFEVDPGFTRDTWVQAAEVLPGNRAVVHHCNVFLKPPGAGDAIARDRLGSYCFVAMAVGTPPLRLPPGTAKLVPAGWKLEFVVHYTPVGSPQTDCTRLGLWLADPKEVRREVATKLMVEPDLLIPPRAASHEVSQTWAVNEDIFVYGLFPHMHLRGKSFRYEIEHLDGTVETLLNVPRFDFNWQHRYELAEPKRVPQGSRLRCTAIYDNSSANMNNPDPSAAVRAGPQSWDEMFNGYWEVALADQDLTQPANAVDLMNAAGRWLGKPAVLASIFVTALVVLRLGRRRKACTQAT
jgi:peroxiredoxin